MDTKQKNPESGQRRPQQRPSQRPGNQQQRLGGRPANPRQQPPGQQKPRQKAPQDPRRGDAARRKNAPADARTKREEAARAAKLKAMRQEAERKTKRRVRKPRRPMQPVVYTQPQAFNRSRLAVQLITVMAVVMALILGLSVFFRVKTVTVSGAEAYSAWAVREASGIQEGDYLLTFSRAKAAAKIEAELPYVYKARIGIKLPDTVNIVIEEIDVVYAIQSQDGIWWLITSEGEVMEQSDTASAANYTKVLGVKLDSPAIGEPARAYEDTPVSSGESTDSTEETILAIPATVTASQKLSAALDILQVLELNEIVGEAASVDVSDLTRIELWYGTRYQVNLGDTADMDYKVASMKATIAELSSYETGELDCSFITWTDKVGYTPFE